jgi:L-alanine-DL-glutamate epimerase-like enolase superfamily enzyme
MKIVQIETLQADAGWRMFSFLKVVTDQGIIGWSEFNESFGSVGLSDVIRGLAPVLIGRDPRKFEQITQHLHVLTRQSRGGLNQQAIAAIENAMLDVAGKALACRPRRCSAARSGSGSRSTGRISAPIACAAPR